MKSLIAAVLMTMTLAGCVAVPYYAEPAPAVGYRHYYPAPAPSDQVYYRHYRHY